MVFDVTLISFMQLSAKDTAIGQVVNCLQLITELTHYRHCRPPHR